MNDKERRKIQEALKDARIKSEKGGKHPQEHYIGWIEALTWVLLEV